MNIEKPNSMPQLRDVLGQIMKGALSGEVPVDTGKLALKAAAQVVESVKAETQARALAFAAKQMIESEMPLTSPAFMPVVGEQKQLTQ